VSLIGTWMQNTAQGWLVYQLTGSKVMLGAVTAVGSLPMLLFSVWGGLERSPRTVSPRRLAGLRTCPRVPKTWLFTETFP
jgi:hypothetical protein